MPEERNAGNSNVIDFNQSITATITLKSAGYPDPSGTIDRLVNEALIPLADFPLGDPVDFICQFAQKYQEDPNKVLSIMMQMQNNG